MKKKQLIYVVNKKIFLKNFYKYKFSFLFSNLKKNKNSSFIIKKTKNWFIKVFKFSIIPFNINLFYFNNKKNFLNSIKKIKPFFFKYKYFIFNNKLLFLMKKMINFKKFHILYFFKKIYFYLFLKLTNFVCLK